MDAMTERMLAASTIDKPVETRQLFLDMEASLPIPIRFNEQGLKGLKAHGVDIDTKDDGYQIEELLYSGDMGGILCSAATTARGKKTQAVISITHLKVDPAHPLAGRIKEYQKKRTLALAIANSGTRRAATKPKRNKRGFGV
jgi:hypothetical protein